MVAHVADRSDAGHRRLLGSRLQLQAELLHGEPDPAARLPGQRRPADRPDPVLQHRRCDLQSDRPHRARQRSRKRLHGQRHDHRRRSHVDPIPGRHARHRDDEALSDRREPRAVLRPERVLAAARADADTHSARADPRRRRDDRRDAEGRRPGRPRREGQKGKRRVHDEPVGDDHCRRLPAFDQDLRADVPVRGRRHGGPRRARERLQRDRRPYRPALRPRRLRQQVRRMDPRVPEG